MSCSPWLLDPLIARLARGEATVKELAEPYAISGPAISRHLKVLARAGLITRRRAAQSRPTSLRIEGLREADEWMDTCRAVWEGRVQRLDAHINGTYPNAEAGWTELMANLERLLSS